MVPKRSVVSPYVDFRIFCKKDRPCCYVNFIQHLSLERSQAVLKSLTQGNIKSPPPLEQNPTVGEEGKGKGRREGEWGVGKEIKLMATIQTPGVLKLIPYTKLFRSYIFCQVLNGQSSAILFRDSHGFPVLQPLGRSIQGIL